MAVIAIIGQNAAIKQGTDKTWNPVDGEIQTVRYRGVSLAVANLYDAYKLQGNFLSTYDNIDYRQDRGVGELVLQTSVDGDTFYELLSNEITRAIWSAPYFTETATVLTAAQFDEVMSTYNHYENNADGSAVKLPSDFSGKQAELYKMMEAGIHEYYETAYVIRETKTVSRRSGVTASFTKVNEVDSSPPKGGMVNALPDGEWLKRAPNVVQFGPRRWRIVTEWWWATKWLANIYPGGSLTLT